MMMYVHTSTTHDNETTIIKCALDLRLCDEIVMRVILCKENKYVVSAFEPMDALDDAMFTIITVKSCVREVMTVQLQIKRVSRHFLPSLLTA